MVDFSAPMGVSLVPFASTTGIPNDPADYSLLIPNAPLSQYGYPVVEEWHYNENASSLTGLTNGNVLASVGTAPTFGSGFMTIAPNGTNGVRSTTLQDQLEQTVFGVFRFNQPPTGDLNMLWQTREIAPGGIRCFNQTIAPILGIDFRPGSGLSMNQPSLAENDWFFFCISYGADGWESLISDAVTEGDDVAQITAGQFFAVGNSFLSNPIFEVLGPTVSTFGIIDSYLTLPQKKWLQIFSRCQQRQLYGRTIR